MEDQIWRDECVLNETGKIYTGNWEQIGHRPWNYAQVRILLEITDELSSLHSTGCAFKSRQAIFTLNSLLRDYMGLKLCEQKKRPLHESGT